MAPKRVAPSMRHTPPALGDGLEVAHDSQVQTDEEGRVRQDQPTAVASWKARMIFERMKSSVGGTR